jgi:hypothetical protein
MKKNTFLVILVVLGASLLICLILLFDPFYEWKLNRAKSKYGIELRPKNVEWIEDSYRLNTLQRQYNVIDDDGRRISYMDERYPMPKSKFDNVTIRVQYGWICDSIIPPVELIATYMFDNKLFHFELKDTVFFKNYIHFFRMESSKADTIKTDTVGYDEIIDYMEFCELKSAWEQGKKEWVQPEEQHF